MPPYYSIFFTLQDYSHKRFISLSSIYEALLTNGFMFGGKYPINKDKNTHELKSIIDWNQIRFNNNFRLGWTQNKRMNYQQFLLLHPLFNHCRVITSSRFVCVIIPEHEVTFSDFRWYTSFESLNIELTKPLKILSLNVWSTGLVTSIQTAPENGGYTPYENLIEGKVPFICPFAILDKICVERIQHIENKYKIIKKELNTGILIESKEGVYGR